MAIFVGYLRPMNAKASEIIDALGGTAEVARLCETSMQAVSNWRQHGIPKPWLKYLQAAKPSAFVEAREQV